MAESKDLKTLKPKYRFLEQDPDDLRGKALAKKPRKRFRLSVLRKAAQPLFYIILFSLWAAGPRSYLIGSVVWFIALVYLPLFGGRWVCGWACPYSIAHDRVFIHLKYKRMDSKWLRMPWMWLTLIIIWLAEGLAQLDYIPEYPVGYFAAAFIFGIMFFPRIFCRWWCPLGAFPQYIARFRFFGISRKAVEKCEDCKNCTRVCPMFIPVHESEVVHESCIACFECVDVCPEGAVKMRRFIFKKSDKPKGEAFPESIDSG
ncbi:4Fe-4S binding protein [Spirochaetota bacterium]